MSKKWVRLLLPAAMLLLLSGCLFRPPDELYKRPEKSAGYDQLVAAIQEVRSGLEDEFSARCEDAVIVSGDNTATIQLQDLNGDGQRESAVAFFRIPGVEKSLKIYIFTQMGEDYQVTGIVEGDGAAIYSVDYVDLNGLGDKELVVNWQVSTGVYQLGAYTLDELSVSADQSGTEAEGAAHVHTTDRSSLLATELLLTGCSAASESSGSYTSGYRLLDIDQDTRTEIAVVRINSAGMDSQVEVYGWKDGQLGSIGSVELSDGVATLNKVRANYLSGEYYPPALYVSCTLTDGSRTTDVLTYQAAEGKEEKQLVNLSLDPETGVSRNRIKGYTEVSPADVNADMVLELPSPSLLPSYGDAPSSNFWLIDWSQYDEAAQCNHVMTTYHNVSDGWYLEIPDSWIGQITISRNDTLSGQRQVIFSLWQGDEEPLPFLSIYRLTGSNRVSRAEEEGRFTLCEEGEVIYAARFYDCEWDCGLTANDLLMKNFQTIQTGWYS
ncbi:MAG: hypothetical protein AB7E30_04950 [Lawsonibacter sp.]